MASYEEEMRKLKRTKKEKAADYENECRKRYAMLRSKGLTLPPYEEWKKRLM